MRFLLTGFEPFGDHALNPSQALVARLDGTRVGGTDIVGVCLPVSRVGGPTALLEALEQHRPDAVLCLGLAAGRAVITVERVAVNLMDYGIADNEGELITDLPISENGPAAYFATLPVRLMVEAMQHAGVPAELSLSAGAYLCNQVMYTLLHTLAATAPHVPAGFIHLPALLEEAAASKKILPSMALGSMEQGIVTALAALGEAMAGTASSSEVSRP